MTSHLISTYHNLHIFCLLTAYTLEWLVMNYSQAIEQSNPKMLFYPFFPHEAFYSSWASLENFYFSYIFPYYFSHSCSVEKPVIKESSVFLEGQRIFHWSWFNIYSLKILNMCCQETSPQLLDPSYGLIGSYQMSKEN